MPAFADVKVVFVANCPSILTGGAFKHFMAWDCGLVLIQESNCFVAPTFDCEPNSEVLVKIAERIDAGKIKVCVNRTFPLEEVNTAMAYRMRLTRG